MLFYRHTKQSPSFEREYNLKYQGKIGNVFSIKSIDRAVKLGLEMESVNISPDTKKVIALDPGWGSSNFGIVALQYINGKIQVIHAEEHNRPNFNTIIDEIWKLKHQYGYVSNIYVDKSSPVIWQAVKKEFDEIYDEQYMKDTIATVYSYNLYYNIIRDYNI